MKKLQLFGLIGVLGVILAASPASAYTFQPGGNLGKFYDYASFYAPNGDGTAATALPVLTDAVDLSQIGNPWDQTVFQMTTLYQPPAPNPPSNQYYSGSNPQLLGMVYDVAVGDVILHFDSTGTILDSADFQLVSAGRYSSMGYSGGRLDLWANKANDFDPGMPADWGYGSAAGGSIVDPFTAGNFDTFPTVTDAANTAQLSGTLVPNGDGTIANAASPYFGADILITVNLIYSGTNAGTGSTDQGYVDVLYNATGSGFEDKTNPAGYTYQISLQQDFTFWPNEGILDYESDAEPFDDPNTDAIYWDTQSNDPVRFSATAIPEPATLSLLSMALVGLGGLVRKRMS